MPGRFICGEAASTQLKPPRLALNRPRRRRHLGRKAQMNWHEHAGVAAIKSATYFETWYAGVKAERLIAIAVKGHGL